MKQVDQLHTACVNIKIHELASDNTCIIATISRRLAVGNDESHFMKKIIVYKQVIFMKMFIFRIILFRQQM